MAGRQHRFSAVPPCTFGQRDVVHRPRAGWFPVQPPARPNSPTVSVAGVKYEQMTDGRPGRVRVRFPAAVFCPVVTSTGC